MEVIGILLLFGFLLMAFWCLITVILIVKGWVMLGAREMFVRSFGNKLGMKENYPHEESAEA